MRAVMRNKFFLEWPNACLFVFPLRINPYVSLETKCYLGDNLFRTPLNNYKLQKIKMHHNIAYAYTI